MQHRQAVALARTQAMPRVRPSSQIESLLAAARIFVRAMIERDGVTLAAINRGGKIGYPTGYLLKHFSPAYGGRRLGDLCFEVDKLEHRVRVESSDGTLCEELKFTWRDEQYFFSHYNRY